MKKVAVMVLMCVLCASVALGAVVTLTGALAVTKDADGKVTGAKLTVKDGDKEVVYTVAPACCDNCKKACDLGGKTVKVTGEVTEKDGVKTVDVKTCEEVK